MVFGLNFIMVFGLPESNVSRSDLVTDAARLIAFDTCLTGVSVAVLRNEP